MLGQCRLPQTEHGLQLANGTLFTNYAQTIIIRAGWLTRFMKSAAAIAWRRVIARE